MQLDHGHESSWSRAAARADALTVSEHTRAAPRTRASLRVIMPLILLLLVTGGTISAAMLRNSATFDEIVMIAGGARGYETGGWQIAPEHPPFVQYMYGLPVFLSSPVYPEEPSPQPIDAGYRYRYAQAFFWQSGNDPERLAALGRVPAVLCALLLVLLVFFYGRRIAGDEAGLIAAALTAALPDVLAHGGVAYNDIPIALALLASVWAIDEALRRPSVLRAAAAGGMIGIALVTKNSAIALAPIALALLLLEAYMRWRDAAWRRDVIRASAVVLVTTYAVLVLVYRGDFALVEYRYAIGFAIGHVTRQAVPSFLLGETSLHGWWYFFPVAFLFKTSAGFHALTVVAAAMLVRRGLAEPRRIAVAHLRAPLVALIVFGALLLRSDLNIGFRYALPALPLVCIGVAVGLVLAWRQSGRTVRGIIVAASLWAVVHTASYYPYFISYISEYGPGPAENHQVLVDSSLDWGQGLLALRDLMEEQGIESVYLSYFGSALPAGYGIEHVPLVSFFPLPPQAPPAVTPVWVALSATSLSGTYFYNDPFADFRRARPDFIVGGSIYVYRLQE